MMSEVGPRQPSQAVDSVRGDSLSDRSLLRRFQNGQPDAATQLYLRYADRLLKLAAGQCAGDLKVRIDPEDIVQSVFRTFFRRAVRGHYDVPEGEELWKLFLVIALHKIRSQASFHRAGKRDVRATITGVAGDEAARHVAGPDETALATLRLVISELLDGLPPTMRPIVELRVEGHEVEEIARRTRRSRRSIERALQEFRQRLSGVIHEDA